MRILIVIPAYFPRWGGAENQAREQVSELVRRGHRVTVLTWRRDASWLREEVIAGARVYRVDRLSRAPIQTCVSLIRMLMAMSRLTSSSEIIVAHHLLSVAYLAAVVGALRHVPVVVLPVSVGSRAGSDLHPLMPGVRFSGVRRLILLFPRRSGAAVALSRQIADELRSIGFATVAQIPNGVLDPGPVDVAELREQLLRPLVPEVTGTTVVAAGRLEYVKGFDVLLEAWSRSNVALHGHLLVIGSGSEEAALRRLASSLGIEHSVVFVGESDRARDYLALADLVVLPSRYEGLSNVLLESLVAGVPVVSTAVSGSVDFIRDGVNGRIVPIGDVDALAAGIDDVSASSAALASRAREAVWPTCSIESVVDLQEQLFARLVAT